MLNFPNELSSIVIKLNMCDYRKPETGAVSDPAVVGELLKWLRSRYSNANIYLVENDATVARADVLFRWLGFDSLAKRYEARVVNLAKEVWITKKIDGYLFNSIEVPKLLDDADLIITHPKLKTHSLTQITCGLKNMYGCLRQPKKVRFHRIIDKVIADVNLAMNADLSIVDANICHEGISGPASGNPKRLGIFVGGSDVVAVDAFCARLAGFRAESIGHIKYSHEKGVGSLQYRVEGDDISDIMQRGVCILEFDKRLFMLLRLAKRLGVNA
jgi:uncharacterized protein (DUF362 family)